VTVVFNEEGIHVFVDESGTTSLPNPEQNEFYTITVVENTNPTCY